MLRRLILPKGRPREFDADKALDRAMKVFWCKGYEGTSLPDLTKAMGINRPSLYAAFGNKEALFRKVIDRYAQGPGSFFRDALGKPAAREVVQRLLHGAIDMLTSEGNPHGCLMVHGALTCSESAEPIKKELIVRRAANYSALRKRFERAKAEKDLPRNAKPADLARYIATVVQGMTVQAAGGATRKELRRVAAMVMRVWDWERTHGPADRR